MLFRKRHMARLHAAGIPAASVLKNAAVATVSAQVRGDMWRHQRMWNHYKAWRATRSTPAEPAGAPALEPERMAEDSMCTKRAPAPVEQQPERRAMAAGAAALGQDSFEFCPGLSMAVVESAWYAAIAKTVWDDRPHSSVAANRAIVRERLRERDEQRHIVTAAAAEAAECARSGLSGKAWRADQNAQLLE